MGDIANSIVEAIKNRSTSASIGTYVFFWVAYHWQGLYVALFVDEKYIAEKFNGLLKNEYLNQYFFGYNGLIDWDVILGFLIPVLLTYLFIWWLPDLILVHLYRREQRYKVKKRIIKLEEEKAIEKEKEKVVKQEDDTLKAEIKKAETTKKAVKADPTIIWQNELDEFTDREDKLLTQVLTCVYKFRGNLIVSGEFHGSLPVFELEADALRLGDSKGLVTIVDEGERIELTEKGKYFASQFEGTL